MLTCFLNFLTEYSPLEQSTERPGIMFGFVFLLLVASILRTIICCKCPRMFQFSSVAQSCLTLWPHEPQQARPPCPSPTAGVYPNPCPLSWWCHPSHPLSSPSPPALNLSQHQGLFQWVSSSHQVAMNVYWINKMANDFSSPVNIVDCTILKFWNSYFRWEPISQASDFLIN